MFTLFPKEILEALFSRIFFKAFQKKLALEEDIKVGAIQLLCSSSQ